jgi:hypothetical protein
MVLESPSLFAVSRWDSISASEDRMTLDPLALRGCLTFALLIPESVSLHPSTTLKPARSARPGRSRSWRSLSWSEVETLQSTAIFLPPSSRTR